MEIYVVMYHHPNADRPILYGSYADLSTAKHFAGRLLRKNPESKFSIYTATVNLLEPL